MSGFMKHEIENLIKATRGRIFTVSFRKLNGDHRKMNCRLGVTKHLRGGSLSYDPAEKGNMIVFDLKAKDYRSFSLARLISFRCGSTTWRAESI